MATVPKSPNVEMKFYECEALGADRPAHEALDLLTARGIRIYGWGNDEPLSTPADRIGRVRGDLSLARIRDERIHHGFGPMDANVALPGPGFADLRIFKEGRRVFLSMSTFAPNSQAIDAIANSLALVADDFWGLLRPRLGVVDAFGENLNGDAAAERVEIPQLYWKTYYGPPHVEKFGREFLLGAPAWSAVDGGERGVALTMTPRWTDWLRHPPGEVIEYFRGKCPGVRQYRSRGVDVG